MSTAGITIVCLFCLSALIVGALLGVVISKRDISILKDYFLSIALQEQSPKKRLWLGISKQTLDTVRLLATKSRLHEKLTREQAQAHTLGAKLTAIASENQSDFSAMKAILSQLLHTNATSAALALEENEKPLSIHSLFGLSSERVKSALTDIHEQIKTQALDFPWGYQTTKASPLYDFSGVGISYFLTVPLRRADAVIGFLWIGFSDNHLALSASTRALIQELCNHAATAFEISRRMQQSKEELQSDQKFLLGVSHDIRSPGLSALYLLRDTLENSDVELSIEHKLQLQLASDCLEEQLDLVSDVLEGFSMKNRNRERAQSVSEICSCLSSVIERFELLAKKQGIRISVIGLTSLEACIDPRHLRRIISNLLSNALKYTAQGEIELLIHAEDELVSISVIDSGIGVPDEKRHLLFEDFQRFDNAKDMQGIGLGLAVCKSLAELNSGSLSYQPTSNGGSKFTLMLKRKESKEELPSELMANSVLVFDDDPAVCRTTERYLRGHFENIHTCITLEQAQSHILKHNPNLLVSDFMFGETACTELLFSLREKGITTPILIVSGSTSEAHQALKNLPSCHIIEKPYSRETLLLGIRHALFNCSLPEKKLAIG